MATEAMQRAMQRAFDWEARLGTLQQAAYGYGFAIVSDIWSHLDGPARRRADALVSTAHDKAMRSFVAAYAEAAATLDLEFPNLAPRPQPELPRTTPPARGRWIRADHGEPCLCTWHIASGDLSTRVTPIVAVVSAQTICGQGSVDLARSDEHGPRFVAADDIPSAGKVCRRCARMHGRVSAG